MEAARYCNMEFTDGVAGLESRPPLADGGTRDEHGWCTRVGEFVRYLKCCWMAVVFWSSVRSWSLGRERAATIWSRHLGLEDQDGDDREETAEQQKLRNTVTWNIPIEWRGSKADRHWLMVNEQMECPLIPLIRLGHAKGGVVLVASDGVKA